MSEMTPLFERRHVHIHLDPNRPPMTKKEVVELSQLIGGIKRSTRTIENATASILKFEDRADKPSDSGMLINAGLKCLYQAKYWLAQSIDVLNSARKYAKEGK